MTKSSSFAPILIPTAPFPELYYSSEKVFNLYASINDPAEINLTPFEIKLLPAEIQIDPLSSLIHPNEFILRHFIFTI